MLPLTMQSLRASAALAAQLRKAGAAQVQRAARPSAPASNAARFPLSSHASTPDNPGTSHKGVTGDASNRNSEGCTTSGRSPLRQLHSAKELFKQYARVRAELGGAHPAWIVASPLVQVRRDMQVVQMSSWLLLMLIQGRETSLPQICDIAF